MDPEASGGGKTLPSWLTALMMSLSLPVIRINWSRKPSLIVRPETGCTVTETRAGMSEPAGGLRPPQLSAQISPQKKDS